MAVYWEDKEGIQHETTEKLQNKISLIDSFQVTALQLP